MSKGWIFHTFLCLFVISTYFFNHSFTWFITAITVLTLMYWKPARRTATRHLTYIVVFNSIIPVWNKSYYHLHLTDEKHLRFRADKQLTCSSGIAGIWCMYTGSKLLFVPLFQPAFHKYVLLHALPGIFSYLSKSSHKYLRERV